MRRPLALIPALACLAVATATAQQATTPPPEQRTAEEQKTMPPRDARWTRLDADLDGRVSPLEAHQDSAFASTFDEMDSDDDGFVSNAEFVAFGEATATRSASQGTATERDEAASATTSTGGTAFAGLDKDKDGRVSSTEAGADATFDSGFAAMDDNGDGFVTDAEFRAHVQAKKQP